MAKRFKTRYPGVSFIVAPSAANGKKEERVYYIRFRKNGRLIEEKAGRQFQDNMTPAKAANIRAAKIEGRAQTREEKREEERAVTWTVGKLWEEYIAAHPGLKSYRTDKTNYEVHLKPCFESKEPKDISPFEVDKLRVKLLKTKAPQTVKHILALLRRLIRYGVDLGCCEGLSFSIKTPQVDNLKTEDLSHEELARLLKTLDEEPDIQAANLVRMALFTGMRRGELFRLKWQNVDFDRGFIRIVAPKGGKSQSIPLNEPARKILKGHPIKKDSPFVFPGRGGKQRMDIKRPLDRIKKNAGLPEGFRPLHGLRHTYASILASSGKVDMYTLQKLLTHKSPQMTQRYAHLRDEALREASELAGTLVNDALGKKTKSESSEGTVKKQKA
jgi:integrase